MSGDHGRARRLEELFHLALARPADQRATFLEESCGSDSELRAEVELLLAAAGRGTGELLAELVGPTMSSTAPDAEMPDRLGPYLLRGVIGRGGFGVVYLAEQHEPIRRTVALKVLAHGAGTSEVIARFEAERQALALMEHPGIASVHEAGTTEDGRPYFVMEHVPGRSITDYCDERRLATDDRLSLLMKVCDAVQHAHQKGVIHRDLKPSNVLVVEQGGAAQPKVIDFGVAKARGEPLTLRAGATHDGTLLGTPQYMAPEQAEAAPAKVDTRTDVHALGLLLYELLVGVVAFEGATLEEILRSVREREPEKPSSLLARLAAAATDVAERQQTDAGSLERRLRGDFDWITMKALSKERARRYDSPGELAKDLERHLRHEPVLAGPPSVGYRARKFVRRHRLAVVSAAAVAAVLVGGIVATSLQATRARRAERDALAQLEVTRRVNDFLNDDLLSFASPMATPDRDLTVRQVLDQAAERLDSRFTNVPVVRAALLTTVGLAYKNLGDRALAEPYLHEAWELRKEALGEEHVNTLIAQGNLALLYMDLGRHADAEPLVEQAYRVNEAARGPDDHHTLTAAASLALLHDALGNEVRALELYAAVLEGRRRVSDADHVATLRAMSNLASLHRRSGRLAEAESLLVDCVEGFQRTKGPEHPQTLLAMNNFASLLQSQGKLDEAEALFLETLEAQRRTLGDEHPDVLTTTNNLAGVLHDAGKMDGALDYMERGLELCRRIKGPEHPNTTLAMTNLATVYYRLGRLDDARSLFEGALDIQRRTLGEEHRSTLSTQSRLAGIHAGMGRFEEAVALLERTVEAQTRTLGPKNPNTLESRIGLSVFLPQLGRHDEAESGLLAVHAAALELYGEEHPRVAMVRARLAALYQATGRPNEAARWGAP